MAVLAGINQLRQLGTIKIVVNFGPAICSISEDCSPADIVCDAKVRKRAILSYLLSGYKLF